MNAVRKELTRYASSAARGLAQNKVLNALERGWPTVPRWHKYAIERYKAAHGFQRELEAAIVKCEEEGFPDVAAELRCNLDDELGIVDGVVYPDKAHEKWRIDFYAGMGITEADIRAHKPFMGSLSAAGVVSQLIDYGSALELAGSILFIELFIPLEWNRVRKGLYPAFPHAFVLRDDDSPETRARKIAARLYVEDHIRHDAKEHFPRLRNALVRYAHVPENMAQIKAGIDAKARARAWFYESLRASFNL